MQQLCTWIFYSGQGKLRCVFLQTMTERLNICSVDRGLSEEDAHQRIWMFDINGLLVHNRPAGDLDEQAIPFAHDYKHLETLEAAVKELSPRYKTAYAGCNG